MKIEEAKEHRNTRWHNPTKEPTHAIVMREQGRWVRYPCPPGGYVEIPSEYDSAIQKVYNGMVQGGLCPQWVRADDANPPPMHPAIDSAASERKILEEAAIQAVANKLHAEQKETEARLAADVNARKARAEADEKAVADAKRRSQAKGE